MQNLKTPLSPLARAMAGSTDDSGCGHPHYLHADILPHEVDEIYAKLLIQKQRMEFDWDCMTFRK